METQSEIKFIPISKIQKGHWYTWGTMTVYIRAIENGENLKDKSRISMFAISKQIKVPRSYQILYHKLIKEYTQNPVEKNNLIYLNNYVYFEIPDKLKILLL